MLADVLGADARSPGLELACGRIAGRRERREDTDADGIRAGLAVDGLDVPARTVFMGLLDGSLCLHGHSPNSFL